jgi:hypothetical protein
MNTETSLRTTDEHRFFYNLELFGLVEIIIQNWGNKYGLPSQKTNSKP